MVAFVKIPIVLEENSMKARMKKLISISVLVLALLVVLGVALADSAQDPVTIYGSEVDLNTKCGKATLIIRDEEFVGTVLVSNEAPPVMRGDRIYLPAAVHSFDFGDAGTLETIGEEFLQPTDKDSPVYSLHGNAEIRDATGCFTGVSGELRIYAEIDYGVMQANFQANGVVSGYGD
jgi:hypothetical protein